MLSIRFKRGTTAQLSATVEAVGVLTIDQETFNIHIHDGITEGGHVINNSASLQQLQESIDELAIEDVDGLTVALASKIALTELGRAEGVTQLNPEGVVPTEQLPSWVEEVITVDGESSLPTVGEVGKLYVTRDTNELYRWSGGQAVYYRITATLESTDGLSEGQVRLYFTEARTRQSFDVQGDLTYDPVSGVLGYERSVVSVNDQEGEVVLGKTDVGLDSVENYGIASEQAVADGTSNDSYVTPALSRVFAEALGFSDAEGSWSFSAEFLAALGLKETWAQLTNGPEAIMNHTAVAINGKMYVYGGSRSNNSTTNSLHEYDPTTDSWTSLSDGPVYVRSHTAVAINGKMYVYGGVDGSVRRNRLYEYDPVTDQWSQLASGPQTTGNHSAAVIDGKMYVYGGHTGSARIRGLYVYDPQADSWSSLTNGPHVINSHSAVAINGKMYVYGGIRSNYTNGLHVYDPITDSWTQLTDGPQEMIGHSAVVIHDKMYIYGGNGSTGVGILDTLHAYDPAEDQWSTLNNGLEERSDHSATVIDNKMYIYGGSIGSTRYNTLYVVE